MMSSPPCCITPHPRSEPNMQYLVLTPQGEDSDSPTDVREARTRRQLVVLPSRPFVSATPDAPPPVDGLSPADEDRRARKPSRRPLMMLRTRGRHEGQALS